MCFLSQEDTYQYFPYNTVRKKKKNFPKNQFFSILICLNKNILIKKHIKKKKKKQSTSHSLHITFFIVTKYLREEKFVLANGSRVEGSGVHILANKQAKKG